MKLNAEEEKAARLLWRTLLVDLATNKAVKALPEGPPPWFVELDPTGCIERTVNALEEFLNLQLWAIVDRTTGAIHAAPSIRKADEVATRLGGYISPTFFVQRWPHSAEQHAAGLKKWPSLCARVIDDVEDIG